MRRLYSARVARPLSTSNTRPTRLGYSTTAWCPHEDLIAVISGCGAVAVFHADAPGESALLVGYKRSPARHVVWRNSQDKALMLVVVDAAGRITFWMSRDRRVNIWYVASYVEVPSVVISIGWNQASTALAAILNHGTLEVWHVPDYPSCDRQPRRMACGASQPHRPVEKPGNQIRLVTPPPDIREQFDGHLRCGSVAPGHVNPYSVAIATVSVKHPTRLVVWHVSIPKSPGPAFGLSLIAATEMPESSSCVACAAVPSSGMLFAIGDKGLIARWFLRGNNGADRGWQLQAQAQVNNETNEAVDRKILSHSESSFPSDANSRGIEASRRRKVYSFEISRDCQTMLTSTSAGLLLWNIQNLKIVAGHRVDCSSNGAIGSSLNPDDPSPYWGLCVSPTGAAAFALNGKGSVDSFSLKSPILYPAADDASAISIAKHLLCIPHREGLRGGWDLLATIAYEGPEAAKRVENALNDPNYRGLNHVTPEKIEFVKQLTSRVIYVEDASAAVARNLLELATEAIRHSAPDFVKSKLSVSPKDGKTLTSPTNISNVCRQMLRTIRVSPAQLVAAPLADWIMVLCAVWLQRCAEILVKYDPKGERIMHPWVNVAELTSSTNDEATRPYHGIVYDTPLARMLRPASFCALLLLALEEENREPEATPRYFRFPKDDAPCIVAAFWDVSLAWEAVDVLSRSVNAGGTTKQLPTNQLAEKMGSTTLVLGKHLAAAEFISNAPELRVDAAEKALGLHGAAKGAGFIMSCIRKHQGQPNGFSPDSSMNNNGNNRAEWCQHDIVTGRPLPPWAPLRRCVVSGLLSVEITQQKSDLSQVNMASPWISKWAYESPFGGRWARVPSLDLDRYELLQPVHQVSTDASNSATTRSPPKNEETIAAPGHVPPPQQAPPQVGPPSEISFASSDPNPPVHLPPGSISTPNHPGPTPINENMPMPQYSMGGNGSPVVPPAVGGVGRPHPSRGTMSNGPESGTKRRGGRGNSGRPPLRKQYEPRTPTQGGQPSEISGLSGIPSGTSPATVVGGSRGMQDTMSARSGDSAVGPNTGGVDQDPVDKRPQKRRKAPKTQAAAQSQQRLLQQHRQPPHQQNGVPPFVPGGGVNMSGGVNPQVNMSIGMPQNMMFNQPGFPQGPPVARSNMSRKHVPMMKNQNQSTAEAAEAAGAAAAAAAAATPAIPMSRSLDQNNAVLQDGLGGRGNMLGGTGTPDNMSSMINPNLMNNKLSVNGSKGNLTPMGMSDFNLISAGMSTGSFTVNPTNGMPVGNVNASSGLPPGNDFSPLGGSGMGLSPGGPGQSGMTNMNLMQSIPKSGNQVNAQNLAMRLGIQPDPLNNLPSHAVDALNRKAALSLAAAGGMPVGMSNEMNMMNNGMMGSAGMNGLDVMGNMNGNPNMNMNNNGNNMNNVGMGGNMMGNVGTSMGPDGGLGVNLSNLGGMQGNSMPGGDANSMMSMDGSMGMGTGVGNVRGSANESPNMFRSRMANNSFDGIPNVSMSNIGMVDPDGMGVGMMGGDFNLSSSNLDGAMGLGGPGTSVGNMNGGQTLNGSSDGGPVGGNTNENFGGSMGMGESGNGFGASNGTGDTLNNNNSHEGSGIGMNNNPNPNDGDKVWCGVIKARGTKEETVVPCNAIRTTLQDKPMITDMSVSGWPNSLHCTQLQSMKANSVFNQEINMNGNHWFVRFLPSQAESVGKFNDLAKVLFDKEMGFAIQCGKTSGAPGKLFLWSTLLNNDGNVPSILGVFQPDTSQQQMIGVTMPQQQPGPNPPPPPPPPSGPNSSIGPGTPGDLSADNSMPFMMGMN